MNTTTETQGTIEHLDPNTLILETNVRPSGPLTKEFVASIRENGVLTPVLARRDPNGNVIVRAGQRRILAAREAGLASIPAYVVDADDATVERIIQQMVENDQREALTDSDRTVAFQQLALEGLTVQAIAKRTGTKQAAVKNGLAVADNPVAATAIHEHQLTLDQAAVLIEFDDDEDTRAELIEVAATDPAQFAHAAQRARDEHKRTQLKTAGGSGTGRTGIPRPRPRTRLLRHRLHQHPRPRHRRRREGHPGTDRAQWRGAPPTSPSTGPATKQPSATTLPTPRLSASAKPTAQGPRAGPMTDEQKAERKTLIANNKAWASAEVVRREWLTELLTRKTLPKDASTVIAHGLTTHRRDVATAAERGNDLAHTLLGIERGGLRGRRQTRRLPRNQPHEGATRQPRRDPRRHRIQHQQEHLALPRSDQGRLPRSARRVGIHPLRRRVARHEQCHTERIGRCEYGDVR